MTVRVSVSVMHGATTLTVTPASPNQRKRGKDARHLPAPHWGMEVAPHFVRDHRRFDAQHASRAGSHRVGHLQIASAAPTGEVGFFGRSSDDAILVFITTIISFTVGHITSNNNYNSVMNTMKMTKLPLLSRAATRVVKIFT